MLRSHTEFVLLGLLACVVTASGCSETPGGGASATVYVSLKLDGDEADQGGPGDSAATAIEVAGYGQVMGRVIIEGNAPPFPPPVTEATLKDPASCVLSKIPNERLVVSETGGIANVFVFLAKAPPGTRKPEATPQEVVFDQQFCTFIPHALFVQTEQPIRILNDDAVLHNVHTFPQRNSEVNQGIAGNNRVGFQIAYSRGEKVPVQVKCDVHPWMLAWHLPLDHPYGTVTADDGTFSIADLPAGTHKLTLWHEVLGVIDDNVSITIEPDGTTSLPDISVSAARFTAGFRGEKPKTVVLSTPR